jgi:hypothetical protein
MLAERLIRLASNEADSSQLTAGSKNPEIEVSSHRKNYVSSEVAFLGGRSMFTLSLEGLRSHKRQSWPVLGDLGQSGSLRRCAHFCACVDNPLPSRHRD